ELFYMMARNANQGPEAAQFLADWTIFYWAWWISWTPFVGMFIAKISRGRTIREFVTVVIIVPASVCAIWFMIFGGTAMSMELNGILLSESGSNEAMLFNLLAQLPIASVTMILAMFSIVVFFVTSADSASIVLCFISPRHNTARSYNIHILEML